MSAWGKYLIGFCLAIVLVSMPWQWITLFKVANLSYKPIHLAITVIVAAILMLPAAITRILRFAARYSFMHWYGAFLLTLMVSLVWSEDFSSGVSLLVKKFVYFFFFIICVGFLSYLHSQPQQHRRLPLWVGISLAAFVAYSLYVFGTLNRNLVQEYLRAAFSGNADALQFAFYNVLFRFSEGTILMGDSALGTSLRNTLVGSFLIFMGLAFVSNAFTSRMSLMRLVAWACISFCIFLIITSVSRSNTIAMFLMLLAGFGISTEGGRRMTNFRLFLFVMAGTTVLLVVAINIERIAGLSSLVTERLGDISESGRFDIYTDALNKIEESPIFGSGLGSTITFNDEEVQAHNIFLTAWMSAGILGLAFSLLYYGKILYDVYLLWRRKDAWRLPTPIGWVIAFTMLPIVRVLVSGQGDFTLVEWFCMAYFYSALYVNSKVVAQEQASLEAEAATAMPAVAP